MMKPPLFGPGQRIGLFGGSFNPAHYGHYMVALYALKRLQLDWVWWLVSPQNPLKDPSETGEYDERLKLTKLIAKHPRFVVTDLERQANAHNTAETLLALNQTMKQAHFIWIMGADSLANLHNWHHWTDIVEALPLASLARPGYSIRALGGRARSALFPIARQNRSGRKTCHANDAGLGFSPHALAARKLNGDSKLEPASAKP